MHAFVVMIDHPHSSYSYYDMYTYTSILVKHVLYSLLQDRVSSLCHSNKSDSGRANERAIMKYVFLLL